MAAPIGQQLGNYRLTGLLGQGGFADIYLGEHIHLGTSAAIKVLRTQLSSEDVADFRTEARTIAHLVHPNIIQVLDFGVAETSGTPFLVMAYAPNGTLRQRHQRGQIVPPTSIVAYIKQVASALQYAHNQKVIHRDIKPENMLIGRNDEILLSDFGIALPTPSWNQQGSSPDQALSDPGSWNPIGTVTYMAPEQIQGRPLPASDQYALAVVAYEWICGVAPFTGTYVEIAVQKMSTMPSPLRAHVAHLPRDVEGVIQNALSIDPQRRFKSVQAFATALEQAYNFSAPLLMSSSPIEAVLIGPDGRLPLKGEVVAIGRRSSNQIALRSDPKVSARHAELRQAGRDYYVVDLNSTNGTTVNGTKLAPQTLRALQSGDQIAIGDTLFIYEVRGNKQVEPLSDGSTVHADEPAISPLALSSGPAAHMPAAYVPPHMPAPGRAGFGPATPLPPVYGPASAAHASYDPSQVSGTIPSVQ
ncbi:MAG TPA: FHA domain-containing serine/threonine-protein kinase, partial [Ktedonobacteraceae bacterium]|nr:FHA domain-containing serine/threonine-protein kinase [Ktedonobacteraceae bacterium]